MADTLKKELEKEGMQKVRKLITQPGAVNEENLKAILKNGADKFQAEMGRPMTYGEMREMYG